MCKVSQSLIIKCEPPFACGDLFNHACMGHKRNDSTCPHHLPHMSFPHECLCMCGICVYHGYTPRSFICVCCRASGAMANASPDLDNAEAQRQLNNNNRPIGSGFWETECTSSKLFECSRIKALAGQRSHTDQHTHAYSHTTNTPHTHASVGV